MLHSKVIYKLQHLDYLIRLESTGSPSDLAARMNISERSLFSYLSQLKELGIPVSWSRAKNSYIYPTKVRLKIEIGIADQSSAYQH